MGRWLMNNELEGLGSVRLWTVRVLIPEIYLEGLRTLSE
jgi:hypothetical protein